MKNEALETVSKWDKIHAIRWSDVILCLLAFMASRIGIGNFYTVGIGFLGCLYVTKELRFWGALFSLLGILSLMDMNLNRVKYIFIIIVIVLVRKYWEEAKRNFNEKNQTIIISLSLFVGGLAYILVQGITLLGILSTLVETMVAGSITIILVNSVKVLRENRRTPLTTKEAMSMILCSTLILAGMVDFYIQIPLFKEIYFRDILTFMLLISVTYLGGTSLGITISMVMSCILVVIGYMPIHFIPIYAIACMIGGILSPLGRRGVIIGTGLGQLLGFIVFNNRVIDLQIIGAYGIAACISLLLPRDYFGMHLWFGYRLKEEKEEIHLLRVQSILTEKLNYFVEAFVRLAESFSKKECIVAELGDKELEQVIEETGEKLCVTCSMNTFCWKQDIDNTYKMAYEMLHIAQGKENMTIRDIPETFRKNCIQAENFAYMLQFKLDLYKQEIFWKNRMIEHQKLVGEQIGAAARMMEKLIEEMDNKVCFNKEDEEILTEALRAKGIKVKNMMIIEKDRGIEDIVIYTEPCSKKNEDVKLMEGQMRQILNIKVSLEKYLCEEKGCCFKFKKDTIFNVTSGAAICAKNCISGDVYSFMSLRNGQYLLALADGMGSGRIAQEESTATIEMLEDFMDAGFEQEIVVKLINSSLILKGHEETFSTIDITLIDTYTGMAEFLKAGAATSFILRDNKVTTIQAHSFPMGMLKEVDIEVQKIQLENGDIIIMVTDGMLATKEDVLGKQETFKQFILEIESGDPQYIAEYLMRKSRDLLGNEDKDDMTIVAAKIWEKI